MLRCWLTLWEYAVNIQCFVVTSYAENCFVLSEGGEAIVIDPGEAAPEVLEELAKYTVTTVVNTHTHVDHVAGNAGVVEATGAELVCHADAAPMLEMVAEQGRMMGAQVSPSPKPDRFIGEGDTLRVGDTELGVVYVPGHAPGHIAIVGEGCIFGGDVLFNGSIGRTDLPGGDFDTLMTSIREKFLSLPDDTVVYCGHGPETTIGMEKKINPFVLQIL